MSTCFFIGHREVMRDISFELKQVVERHITKYGVKLFIVGYYGQFDRLAAKTVIETKHHHPEVKLTLLLPYHPAERPIHAPEGFDGTYYPFGTEKVPRRFAIVRANRYMVEHSDYLIAYAWHPASNARDLVEYARKREKHEVIKVTILSKQGANFGN